MRGIAYYRKQRKMSQIELAEAIGVRQSTISAYENGTRSPMVSTFARIADVLGVSMDELVKHDRL